MSTSRATWRRVSRSNKADSSLQNFWKSQGVAVFSLAGVGRQPMASRALRRDEPTGLSADLTHYSRDGYAIVRGFFDRSETREISRALDQLHAEGTAHGRCFRHGNLFYNVAKCPEGELLVRMVQWPSYHQPVLNRVRLDGRFADLLAPLVGRD